MKLTKRIPILIADDDQDDILMLEELFAEHEFVNPLHFVSDGVELMNFLRRNGKFEDSADSPRPGIIILSINMPRMDGRAAIEAIKSDKYLNDIPIIVMSSSSTESEIAKSWQYAVHGYLNKPISMKDLMEVFRKLKSEGITIERVH